MAFLIGDSHAGALRDGYSIVRAQAYDSFYGRDHPLERVGILGGGFRFLDKFFVKHDDAIEFTDERMASRLATLTGGASEIRRNDKRKFIFSMGGHVVHFLKAALWSRHSVYGATKSYISKGAFRELSRSYDNFVLSFFQELRELDVEVSVCLCPPPSVGEWEKRKALFPSLEEFVHLVRLYRENYCKSLIHMGINCYTPPDEAISGGLLRCEFLSDKKDDFYHANEQYGKLMIEKLLAEHFCTGDSSL